MTEVSGTHLFTSKTMINSNKGSQNELSELPSVFLGQSKTESSSSNLGIFERTSSKDLQNEINKKYTEIKTTGEKLKPTPDDYNENQLRWKNYVDKQDSETTKTNQRTYNTFKAMLPDKGNGKIDKPAKQIAGNCWLLGNINSLASNEVGLKLLNNNILKDDEKHIIAIHLKEAENNNLPSPDGNGVYTFTEEEIFNAQNRNSETGLASGDGDIAAYALAIEQYLKETKGGVLSSGEKHFSDGEKVSRMYEILTGKKSNEAGSPIKFEMFDKSNSTQNNEKIQSAYNNILDLAKNETGATTLSMFAHAFSVVGTDGESLLIQESNLSETFKKYFELVPDTFPPTYKLTAENFKTYAENYSTIKLK